MGVQGYRAYSSPGKVFLLGEYAVLSGGTAVVAAVGPRFHLEEKDDESADVFPGESPLGRLARFARKRGAKESSFNWRFTDPHAGAGGFGASTAQFALAYRSLAEANGWKVDWRAAWLLYRQLTMGLSQNSTPPSGADLVAQWMGGVVAFDPKEQSATSLELGRMARDFLVLGAGHQKNRKVPTHEHLSKLEDLTWTHELQGLTEQGVEAIRQGDHLALGDVFNSYGDQLKAQGLEIEATSQDRKSLGKLSGVLGIKGTGALQADGLILVLDSQADRQMIERAAMDRDLEIISRGLLSEEGIEEER